MNILLFSSTTYRSKRIFFRRFRHNMILKLVFVTCEKHFGRNYYSTYTSWPKYLSFNQPLFVAKFLNAQNQIPHISKIPQRSNPAQEQVRWSQESVGGSTAAHIKTPQTSGRTTS